MKKYQALTIALLMVCIMTGQAVAEKKISVAVAANFISAFKEMAADFEEKTGVGVEATFASSGSLYNQIKNGAPYDVFLSADEERPDLLVKEGLTDGAIIYARGKVILWSANKDFCKASSWIEALKNGKVKKLSIANPAIAPYGAAAKTALQKTGLWNELGDKLVNARDIAQSFQYANTGAVDAGFCSLSALSSRQGSEGCFLPIPEAPVIIQTACTLKKAKNHPSAELFMNYLLCEHALKIRKKYGYY